ncbi:hypothetical protein MNV49_005567 [Pseudohyphozyma bogoriensis]|nr:hypothetical protein MNV49_005567 [Pseudohyphozyma bogoriensis]
MNCVVVPQEMPHLPPEILAHIFTEFELLIADQGYLWPYSSERNADFARLAFVSKAWQRSAYDVLYGHLVIDWRKTTVVKLLTSFKNNSQLSSMVKIFSVRFMDKDALLRRERDRFERSSECDALYVRCHQEVHAQLDDGYSSEQTAYDSDVCLDNACWEATDDLLYPEVHEIAWKRVTESGDLDWTGKKGVAALFEFIRTLSGLIRLELYNVPPNLPQKQTSSLELAAIFAQLTSLGLSGMGFGSVTTLISLTPHIKSLKLTTMFAEKLDIASVPTPVVNLSQLVDLELQGVPSTIVANLLGHMPALINLTLQDSPSDSSAPGFLETNELPQLHRLTAFNAGPLTTAILACTGKLLTHLTICGYSKGSSYMYGDFDNDHIRRAIAIPGLTNVRSLALHLKKFDDELLDSLSQFFRVNKQFNSVETEAEEIPDQLVAALPTGLKTLRIVDTAQNREDANVIPKAIELVKQTKHLSSLVKISLHYRRAAERTEEDLRPLREEAEARGIELEFSAAVLCRPAYLAPPQDNPFDPAKPTLLFIHPSINSSAVFNEQFIDSRLREGWNLIAIDSRFNGWTEAAELERDDYTFEEGAEELIECLDRLEVKEFSIVGACWAGTNIGAWMTVKIPSRIKSVVLMSPGPHDAHKAVANEMHEEWLGPYLEDRKVNGHNRIARELIDISAGSFLGDPSLDPDLFNMYSTYLEQRYGAGRSPYDMIQLIKLLDWAAIPPPSLAKISCPVLIFYGALDTTSSEASGRGWCEALTGANGGKGPEFVNVAGGGHNLTMTAAGIVNRLLVGFFFRHLGEGSGTMASPALSSMFEPLPAEE